MIKVEISKLNGTLIVVETVVVVELNIQYATFHLPKSTT